MHARYGGRVGFQYFTYLHELLEPPQIVRELRFWNRREQFRDPCAQAAAFSVNGRVLAGLDDGRSIKITGSAPSSFRPAAADVPPLNATASRSGKLS